MKKIKLKTPAEYIIDQFGGLRATARAVGRDPKTIHNWKTKVTRDGLKGRVPEYMHKPILDEAKRRKLNIKWIHLLVGG